MADRNAITELQAYLSNMQRLASISGIEDDGSHPLYKHLAEIRGLLSASLTPKGLSLGKLPTDPHEIIKVIRPKIEAMAMLGNDRMSWLADGYFEELIKDEAVAKFIKQRLPDPDQYPAVIAELHAWGFCKARDLTPRLIQEDGLPDLEFGHTLPGGPFHFDVKYLHTATGENGVRRHIEKANKQIKRVSADTAGGCFIRIEGVHLNCANSNGPPTIVQQYITEGQALLAKGDYKSVGRLVFIWDELCFIGNAPGWTTWVATRRSIELHHPKARAVFSLDASYHEKRTIATNIHIGPEGATPAWDIISEDGGYTVVPHTREYLAKRTGEELAPT